MATTTKSVYLTLQEARAMLDRGVAKARELRQAGAIVVVDAGGNTVSISRMDDSPVSSIQVSRAKAYVAAVQGRPTAAMATTARDRPEIFSAFQHILPKQPFPGPGGVPIFKEGRVVGGIATGGGIGPFTEIPGVDQEQLMVDGVLANAEDLVICTALGIPYQSQHGDHPLREAYSRSGSPSDPVPLSLGEAKRYTERVVEEAEARGVGVGVAVVDEMGRLIQLDRMDESPLISAEMAEAKAMTALKFRRATSTLTEEFRSHSARIEAIEKIAGFTILAMGGGLPIMKDGRLVGALGVSGSGGSGGRERLTNPVNDEEIATAVLA
jgi:glc operon protein GlcG